jgi:hypothetical protein
VREELTSVERVLDLAAVEQLVMRLPDLVGAPLSLNALREDLQVSHKTVSNWMAILERLYAVFRVSPFGSARIRAVKKEQKHYHLDWTLVPRDGPRFENLVAAHLLKWVHHQQDTGGRDVELRYFRDVDGREVDFVLVERGRPLRLVECKWDDAPVDPAFTTCGHGSRAPRPSRYPRSAARITSPRTASGSVPRSCCCARSSSLADGRAGGPLCVFLEWRRRFPHGHALRILRPHRRPVPGTPPPRRHHHAALPRPRPTRRTCMVSQTLPLRS